MAVIATKAAHETPVILVFMLLLFLWMQWKKETAKTMIAVLAIGCIFYVVQDYRDRDDFDYSGIYRGELVFQAGHTIDGDSLRGFAYIGDNTRVYANYRFGTAEEKEEIRKTVHKSQFLITGTFEDPSPPSHKFSFNMEAYLKNNGARKILSIESISRITEENMGLNKIEDRRALLKDHIREHFPQSLSTEAEALLIGEREKMSVDEQRIYQTLGISHLFAISGLHVAIAAGLLYFLLVRAGIRIETALLFMLIVLPLYAILAGSAPSVWRAVSMVSAVLLGRLLQFRISPAHILLISFTAFILINPYVLYKIGFQLSYGACFGIIYSWKFLSVSGSAFIKGLVVTFISQFTLYPLLLFHFYELSLSAFIVNSLFVPLYTLVILPANFFLLFLTFLFQPAADFVFYFYEPLRNRLGDWTFWLSTLPYQMWNPGKPHTAVLAVMAASVLLFYALAEKRFSWKLVWIPLLPALLISIAPYADPRLKLTFLDVGQGDSAVIELPHRKAVYLVDSGGVLRFDQEDFQKRGKPYEIGRQVVTPYLKGKGISSIDAMVLSHPDADHAEGAEEILQTFNVAELHLTPGSMETEVMQDLIPFFNKTEILFPGKGSDWRYGDTEFSYLSPADLSYGGNNDSLVLYMEDGPLSVLFTGDMEAEGEGDLLDNYAGVRDLTILKAGHHGSKTSSSEAFLAAMNPKLSIFSTGRDNRYGHPAPEVVERFNQLELPVLNTAENGTIEIIMEEDGQIAVKTMR